ncbi:SAF domain-containing protein [Williamsia herbipolensis]|uniref:SAF domain-containing protein n=1 Tax=Williamsia herbipolensis TaxID=1603258 RepID=A0AAU4K1N2_9NOCA|nr:SAF domain-containing protein [Williamsia herbipolensis]
MADRTRLSPTLTDRLRTAVRPGWIRTVAVRRVAAITLLTGSIVMAVVAHRGEQLSTVLVAAHDLTPGSILVAGDLVDAKVAPGSVPDGALRMDRDGVGRTVTGPVRGGEILTDWRLLSARLPAQLVGDPDARLVPIRLADDAVIDLLRSGDVVDVLTESADTDSPGPGRSGPGQGRVLVRGAVVAVVPAHDARDRGGRAPVVMLAMPEHDAHAVAGTALAAPVTVVFH